MHADNLTSVVSFAKMHKMMLPQKPKVRRKNKAASNHSSLFSRPIAAMSFSGNLLVVLPTKSAASSIDFGSANLTKISHDQLHDSKLPQFVNSYFDGVFSIATDARSHTPAFLAEVARILKPSGSVYLREKTTKDEVIIRIIFYCRFSDASFSML